MTLTRPAPICRPISPAIVPDGARHRTHPRLNPIGRGHLNLCPLSLVILLVLTDLISSGNAQQKLDIEKEVDPSRLIRASLSGFSGEVQTVLKFDLEIAGFEIVGQDAAQFNISGSNNAFVEGRLTHRATKSTLLANRYEGGPPRTQAHAFADDIVLKLTGKPGIARTRIAFKG